MIRRLYVHNFRCLENFDLPIAGKPSSLLIGKDGAGKSTVGAVLYVLQTIALGTNRVRQLVEPTDFTRGRSDVLMRFEIEVEIDHTVYGYTIAFEFPEGIRELRVFEEKLTVAGKSIFIRDGAQVELPKRTSLFRVVCMVIVLLTRSMGMSLEQTNTKFTSDDLPGSRPGAETLTHWRWKEAAGLEAAKAPAA